MLIDKFLTHIKEKPNYVMEIGSRDLEQAIEFVKSLRCKVISFEPNPNQFKACVETLSLNQDLGNIPRGLITISDFALAEETKELDFYITNGNIGASSTLKPIDVPFAGDKSVTKIRVQGITAHDYLSRNGLEAPSVIWMDVQGAELGVLKGFKDYLKNVKYIHCEGSIKPYYENHQLQPDLIKFLTDSGFKLVEAYGHNLHPYEEGDLIFVR